MIKIFIVDDISYHYGPLDLNCLTFKKPSKIREDLLHSMTTFKIMFKPSLVIINI